MQIARDAVILPGCFLQGHTVIGEAAEVGPYTTLIGATIDAEAHVERSRVQETHIGRAPTSARGRICVRATSSAREARPARSWK